MKHYEDLKKFITSMEEDVQKFYEGNNLAGTRVRKQLQELKKICNDFRADVQSTRLARK